MLTLRNSIAMIAFATFAFGANAQEGDNSSDTKKGGLFVEPMVTYEQGETEVDWPSPFKNSTGDANGIGFGVRLGLHANESIFVAADARYSMPEFKDSSVDYKSEATATNFGAVLGFQMPDSGLRLWGTYIFGGELNPKSDDPVDVKFEEAQGYRVGAGFHLQSVSLNLEYQDLKYDKTKFEKVGPFTGSADSVELSNKTWMASVSFPVEF